MNSCDSDKSYLLEQQVLSILLVNDEMLKESELDPEIFKDIRHRRIYQSLKDICRDKGNIDFIEIVKRNEDIYKLLDYLLALQDQYISSKNFYAYVDGLQEVYKRRKAHEILSKCDNEEITYDEMINEISKVGVTFAQESNATMISALDMYELVTTDNAKLKFARFANLQEKIGLIENTMNIIAARTSVGKSAFALNLIDDLSRNYKCLYMNMEMTEKELYQRLVSINSGVPISEFTKARQNKTLSNKIVQAINIVRSKKIKIYNGSKSIDGIRKIISRECKDGHCIVFIDYVGYVSTRKRQNDRERVGEVTRELQIMTKDFNCTIFLLAQINREGTEAPTLTNLKDSGELEQSGHAILFLHNPSNDINNQTPEYDLIVAKNRSGRLGKLKIIFYKAIQRFEVM